MLPLSTKLAKLVDIRRRIGHTHGSAALVFTVIQLSARARTPGMQMAVRMVSQTGQNTGNLVYLILLHLVVLGPH
jgi:hypothetical protein